METVTVFTITSSMTIKSAARFVEKKGEVKMHEMVGMMCGIEECRVDEGTADCQEDIFTWPKKKL